MACRLPKNLRQAARRFGDAAASRNRVPGSVSGRRRRSAAAPADGRSAAVGGLAAAAVRAGARRGAARAAGQRRARRFTGGQGDGADRAGRRTGYAIDNGGDLIVIRGIGHQIGIGV